MGAEASGGVKRTCKGAADAEQNDVLGFFSTSYFLRVEIEIEIN
jgi:hypothetical protein